MVENTIKYKNIKKIGEQKSYCSPISFYLFYYSDSEKSLIEVVGD